MNNVYFSGSMLLQDTLRGYAVELYENLGIDCTSNWLYEPEITVADPGREDWVLRARANEDRVDLERADAVVLFTDAPSTSGGLWVELGMALALRKPVHLVGPRVNVFCYPSDVKWHDSWESFLMDEFNA